MKKSHQTPIIKSSILILNHEVVITGQLEQEGFHDYITARIKHSAPDLQKCFNNTQFENENKKDTIWIFMEGEGDEIKSRQGN